MGFSCSRICEAWTLNFSVWSSNDSRSTKSERITQLKTFWKKNFIQTVATSSSGVLPSWCCLFDFSWQLARMLLQQMYLSCNLRTRKQQYKTVQTHTFHSVKVIGPNFHVDTSVLNYTTKYYLGNPWSGSQVAPHAVSGLILPSWTDKLKL